MPCPNQLSGGQQQRVGLARSLAVGPALWFLDEPFSALDPLIRRQMQDEFLRLQRMLNKTIVFITHDMQEAFRLADRIAIMRQGEIIQIGRPADIVREPADDYVARFVEDIPLVRVMLAKDIMQPVNGDEHAAAPTTVEPTTTVEDLLARLAGGSSGFRVVDGDAALGAIDAGRGAVDRRPGPAEAAMTALAGDLSRRPRLDPGFGVWLPVLLFVAALPRAARHARRGCRSIRRTGCCRSRRPSMPSAPRITEFVKPAFRGIAWLLELADARRPGACCNGSPGRSCWC